MHFLDNPSLYKIETFKNEPLIREIKFRFKENSRLKKYVNGKSLAKADRLRVSDPLCLISVFFVTNVANGEKRKMYVGKKANCAIAG